MNEWNNLLNGVISAGSSIEQGLVQDNKNQNIQNEYRQTVDYLKKSYADIHDKQTRILDGLGKEDNKSVVPEDTQVDTKPIFEKVLDASLSLQNKGANNYASSLGTLYNNYFPPDKVEDFTLGDARYRSTNGKTEMIAQNRKEEKPKFTVKDYQNMSIEDTENLSDTDFDKGLDYFSEDTKQQLKQKYPELANRYDKANKEGIYTPRSPGRRRYSSSRGKDSLSPVENDKRSELETVGKLIASDDETADDEIKKIQDATGLSYEEVKDAALNQAKGNPSNKDTKEFLDEADASKRIQQLGNDLATFEKDIEENVWGYTDDKGEHHGNYSIPPADWARELQEGGFLDNITDREFKEVSAWFQSKTGKKLSTYIK